MNLSFKFALKIYIMNNKAVISHIVNWIKKYIDDSSGRISTLVVGVSGGIDSAVVSKLCAISGIKTIVLTLPIKSSDIELSLNHCHQLTKDHDNVTHFKLELTDTFNLFKNTCDSHGFSSELGLANTKARIRMITLYQVASSENGIVVGTGNKVEDFGVGFYTKYGDGGVDISPIADLTKSEVRSIAEELKIMREIIVAPPTDGLWEDGRNDEDQLGLTYEEIEKAMSDSSNENHSLYTSIREKNLHKMLPIPVCIIDDKIKYD